LAKELKAVDISDAPELLRLAEEVRASREPRLLRRNGEDLAVLTPLAHAPGPRRTRTNTPADLEAFRSSAGSWEEVDVDRLIADIYTSRERSTRPPVEL
jgi:hypothetical protein